MRRTQTYEQVELYILPMIIFYETTEKRILDTPQTFRLDRFPIFPTVCKQNLII